ncbi:MAG: CidA/LrgA family protein [Ewingella americana]|jgi:holin-like protein|uniref:Holin-like protein n=2 Tax=Ewingella americana TaxID=41202 RepID=A0A085GQ87_EWIA3|nr:CidA/LrgA family protein [Ewingella americana]NWA36514.1 CidA/LrgA family protein [Pseudomonas reactans]KAA8728268.1 CidA/LrgA family protein [Ewingella americana]KFC85882.1 holin-like protein [Ewingella americana ATCC 33852]MCI1677947.1 CidA/LrgA family protein [Ewingella americana]MCI1855835.1 CidA/LrgA family protein [Ewingella americana]
MLLALRTRAPSYLSRLQVPIQVVLYAALYLVADRLVTLLHLPLPANVVGMFMLLLLIMSGILPLKWVKAGSRWLLAEMLLFFVPAVVAVVNYTSLLMVEGWKIFLVIAVSTTLTLGITSLVVDRIYRLELRLAERKVRGE